MVFRVPNAQEKLICKRESSPAQTAVASRLAGVFAVTRRHPDLGQFFDRSPPPGPAPVFEEVLRPCPVGPAHIPYLFADFAFLFFQYRLKILRLFEGFFSSGLRDFFFATLKSSAMFEPLNPIFWGPSTCSLRSSDIGKISIRNTMGAKMIVSWLRVQCGAHDTSANSFTNGVEAAKAHLLARLHRTCNNHQGHTR